MLISDVDNDFGMDSLTPVVITGHCADVNVVGLYFGDKLRAHLNGRLESTFGAVVLAFTCCLRYKSVIDGSHMVGRLPLFVCR